MSGPPAIDETEVLATGELVVVGRLEGSTNHAMLVEVRWTCPGEASPIVLEAVYKPTAGERPLHDFPDGTLTRREVAAFLVSEAMGWRIVPSTVLRSGPFGEGMVQRWIQPDPTVDVIAMVVDCDPRLRRIAIFDAVVNNTDRKGGHLLPIPGGHVYGVDHGVCFSPVPKLRTVLWGWRGRVLTPNELAGLECAREGLYGRLGDELRELLSTAEVAATQARVERLLRDRRFPNPRRDWPAIPFPPF
jgi:uncharacterized repeat protein (TIGR03843 family)